MRRCRRSCGENAGVPAAVHARVTAVRKRSPPKPWNTLRSGVRSSRATSSRTASKTTGGTERPSGPVRSWRRPARRASGRVARRRRVIEVVRSAQRRPRLVAEVELEAPDTVADVVDARDRLRAVLAVALTENERAALARVMRGEPIARHEKTLQSALWRLRRKLAA